MSTCTQDAQCADAGPGGRCAPLGGDLPRCACTSDGCASDSDCAAGSTCACHGSVYTGGLGNSCVPGNCRVDTDCGSGGYCSPSPSNVDISCGGTVAGYYCHTPSDQCTNDSDCATGGGNAACAYSTQAGRWQCVMIFGCAVAGAGTGG